VIERRELLENRDYSKGGNDNAVITSGARDLLFAGGTA
jgi:hypothetical protein